MGVSLKFLLCLLRMFAHQPNIIIQFLTIVIKNVTFCQKIPSFRTAAPVSITGEISGISCKQLKIPLKMPNF